jgi:hypothetical protein
MLLLLQHIFFYIVPPKDSIRSHMSTCFLLPIYFHLRLLRLQAIDCRMAGSIAFGGQTP